MLNRWENDLSVSIENSIFRGLLYSEKFSRKVVPFLKDEYFEGHYKKLYKIYDDYFNKYHTVPSLESMVVSLQKSDMVEKEFEECLEELSSIQESKDDPIDVDWLVDEAESYCQQKALYNGLYKSISIIEGSNKDLSVTAVPSIMTEALAVAFDSNIGSDYTEEFEKRLQYYMSEDNVIRFPPSVEVLNVLSNGGLRPKTLSCVLAGTNVGKSLLMCHLAAHWLLEGINVLYISMEMSEESVQFRIDSNLLEIPTSELDHNNINPSKYLSKAEELKKKKLGKLIVKEYPTSQAHAGHFRHLLNELKMKKGFVPEVIFVDYINICASSRYKGGSGVNSYTLVKSISEELRGLAVETGTAIFTATQTTREGSQATTSIDMTSTSESWALPQNLDFFIAMLSPQELVERNRQLLILLKSRFGNKAAVKPQLIGVDWDHLRYYDVDKENFNTSSNNTVEEVNSNSSKPNFVNKSKDSIKDIAWD